jgi:signal peptidase I
VSEPDSGSLEEPEPLGPGEIAQPLPAVSRRDSTIRWILEVVAIVAAAFLLALLIQLFVLKPYVIPSPSMEPTLVEGDRVLVNRLSYHFRDPEKGDVIVFHPPGAVEGDPPLIKRVVAVGGDVVSVHNGALWVNGVAQDEPYIKEYPIFDEFPEVKIEEGYVWAMGDNRNNSGDSRRFGQVPEASIIGAAFCIYWPLGHIDGL